MRFLTSLLIITINMLGGNVVVLERQKSKTSIQFEVDRMWGLLACLSFINYMTWVSL